MRLEGTRNILQTPLVLGLCLSKRHQEVLSASLLLVGGTLALLLLALLFPGFLALVLRAVCLSFLSVGDTLLTGGLGSSRGWGYYGWSPLGLLVLIVLVLALTGNLSF